MRFREWPLAQWLRFADHSLTPDDTLREQFGYVPDFGYLDTAQTDRLRNTVADRSELAGGLVLTAEYRGWITDTRALVVIGSGPSATLATQVALAREIPVVQLLVRGRGVLAPLAGCYTRWLSPYFYDNLLGVPQGQSDWWEWTVPAAFATVADPDLAELRAFAYGHERAADVAARWIARSDEFRARRPAGLYFSHEIAPLDLSTGRLERVHQLAVAALAGTPFEPGLILHCRFFDQEELLLKDRAGAPIFASVPYWELGRQSPWTRQRGPILISGSRDGALQDFLRWCWNWESLEEACAAHLRLFAQGVFPSACQHLVAEMETFHEFLRDCWDQIDDNRLAAGAAGAVAMARFRALAEEERHDWALQAHEQMVMAVDDVLEHCVEWAEIQARGEPREAYVHTRGAHFGPCYLHNHFFGLLTMRLLERAGRTPHLANRSSLEIAYDGPTPCDFRDATFCAAAAAAQRFSVAGIPKPETILVRHGRRALDLAAPN